MRKHFAIILLAGVLEMHMDMVCQSLCLSGHNDTAAGHASHKTAKHDMPKGDMCPTTHNTDHTSRHNIPKTFIKCDCPADDMVQALQGGVAGLRKAISGIERKGRCFPAYLHRCKG